MACEGTLTIGVRVPFGLSDEKCDVSQMTHVIIKEHEPFLRLPILGQESAEIQSRCLVSRVFTPDILKELLEDRSSPCVTGVPNDTGKEMRVSLGFRLVRHAKTLVDSLGNAEQVVRVDLQRRLKGRGGAHEFGEDKRRLVCFVLAEDKFHRCCVHAVSQGSDQCEVSNGEQAKVFIPLDCLMAALGKVRQSKK